MNTAIQKDISYFAQQPADQIQWLISGMVVLMQDTEGKAAAMQSQNWFQRMTRSVLGKNKLTLEEIKRNHEQLNLYMAEVVAELYNINRIDQRMIMSLGIQLNEIYANYLYLQQSLGAFVEKLNAKIVSVDNFHMLVTEIEQGVYTTDLPLIGICKVLSQFDRRILEDTRKLDIIRRSLIGQGIISEKPVLLQDYLASILSVPMTEAGQVYLELGAIREDFIAALMMKLMEGYHFLPDMARKTKNRKSLIDGIIREESLDTDAALSTEEVYDAFVSSKIEIGNSLIAISEPEPYVAEDVDIVDDERNMDAVQSIEEFFALAEQGDADAQFVLGHCYYHGNDLEQDFTQAVIWYRKAAEQGHMEAQCSLTACLLEGAGVEKDEPQAAFWCRQAAEQGVSAAQYCLGDFLLNGQGVQKNETEAVMWYRKAAEQGMAEAQFELGLCYYNGNGVKKDVRQAYQWFRQSAKQGDAVSQFLMGTARLTGDGAQKDFDDAFEWYRRAAEQELPAGLFGLGVCCYLAEWKRAMGTIKGEDQTEAIQLIQCAIEQGCDIADYALKKSMKRGKIVSAVYLEAGLKLEASNICKREGDYAV